MAPTPLFTISVVQNDDGRVSGIWVGDRLLVGSVLSTRDHSQTPWRIDLDDLRQAFPGVIMTVEAVEAVGENFSPSTAEVVRHRAATPWVIRGPVRPDIAGEAFMICNTRGEAVAVCPSRVAADLIAACVNDAAGEQPPDLVTSEALNDRPAGFKPS